MHATATIEKIVPAHCLVSPVMHNIAMRRSLLLVLLLLTACRSGPFERRPEEAVVNEIEAKLAKIPCIGPMDKWARFYAYDYYWNWSFMWFEYNKIDIVYYEAGRANLRAGRIRYRGMMHRIGTDEHNDRVAVGVYDIPTKTAVIRSCGPNHSLARPLTIR